MQNVTAVAKIKDKDGNQIEEVEGNVEYNFGENLDEAVEMFGSDVVFSNFKQSAVISCQARIRAALTAGKRDNDLQAVIDEWKPGVKTVTRKSAAEKLKDLLSGKTPEEIAAILAEAGVDFEEA